MISSSLTNSILHVTLKKDNKWLEQIVNLVSDSNNWNLSLPVFMSKIRCEQFSTDSNSYKVFFSLVKIDGSVSVLNFLLKWIGK